MILRNLSYEKFAEKIRSENKKIVVYGAGAIGCLLAPYIFNEYKLDSYVSYYVDMDIKKQGKGVELYSKNVEIFGIEKMKRDTNYCILITNSLFKSIVEMLDGDSRFENIECFILPIMQLDASDKFVINKNLRLCGEQLIPKKIHYCWFGKNPIPEELQKCIDSWKKICPDYEIIKWDESNIDVNKYLYTKQAYENKKYGFVPDIIRLELLYEHGGIYLDTDVELLKPLDELLYQKGFCGTEKWGYINIGSCAGSVKGNLIIKEILDNRKNELFKEKDGSLNLKTCGFYETEPLIKKGFKLNNETQIIGDMTVYPSDFFCPFNYMNSEIKITGNTFSIHYFSGSWLGDKGREEREKTRRYFADIINRINGRSD